MDPGAPGAIALRGGSDIALRNEEINRQRMSRGAGGPLRVTDPAALQRLMADMRAKAEQQRAAEEAREAERRAREGDAYLTPEQRAEAARAAREAAAAAADGEEARVLSKRFDPARNYYDLLGVSRGASAADIRRAYKKLALLYHPDKHKGQGEEQQAAIADKFKQVAEAFDVLSDEEQRAVYDKVRDYQEANPGKGLPVLTPEEAALMRSGIAELSRLRRQGAKATKHAPLENEVFVSLAKLNAGCTKTVAVERRRVRPDGAEFLSVTNVHAIIRRGSREGDRLVFEGDGCETVDTQPGDLVLVLRQKPHPLYRRVGPKDLEVFGGSTRPGELLFAYDAETITGKRRLLVGSAFSEAAAAGGAGGVWQAVLPGAGLYDAADPWEQPAGDLRVQLRYPACLLAEATIVSCLTPQPVHLLGGAGDVVAAALAAGSVASLLNHRQEAAELAGEASASGSQNGDCSSPSSSSSSSGCGTSTLISAVCLVVCGAAASPAAAALLRALCRRVPGLTAYTVVAAGCDVLDDEWLAVGRADVLVLDCPVAGSGDAATGSLTADGAEEAAIRAVHARLAGAGVLELVWQRFWAGAFVVGVGQGCALLGRTTEPPPAASAAAPRVLPHYLLRAGSREAGWASLHAALTGGSVSIPGVGLLAGGCWVANPNTGCAEMLAAPPRDALVAAAAWAAQPSNGAAAAGLDDADEEWGFMVELQASGRVGQLFCHH